MFVRKWLLALAIWTGACGLACGQEWRPVSSARTAPTGSAVHAQAVVASSESMSAIPVRLGAPQAVRQPQSSSPAPTRVEDLGVFRLGAERHTTLRNPFQDAGVKPASGFGAAQQPTEEQFNCGVIMEGPVGPAPSFWDRLFGRTPDPGCGTGGHPWFQPSGPNTFFSFRPDREFDYFISPLSNPFFFEDPRSLTEFRPVFIWQRAAGGNPLFRGGDAVFFAFQGRLAINEEWSVVIHKFGFANVRPGGRDDLFDPNPYQGGTGLTDLQIGPKWTFYRNVESRTVAALGLNFEVPIGSTKVQQGNNGAVTPYLTAAQAWGDFNFMGATGYRFGFSNSRSDMLFLSMHMDYNLLNKFYPLAEVNWYYYTKSGNQIAGNFEGADLYNFGADSISGRSLVTLNLGARYKFSEAFQIGAGYEFPLVGRDNGVMDWRLTFDLIFRY